jgi:16S rRNA (cytosine1402-N4)-methyltransferase
MTRSQVTHTPVMLEEVMAALAPRDDGIYVDATFGGGGYTRALLARAECRVIAIDRDPDAIARGADMARAYAGRLNLIHGNFGDMDSLIGERADGVALDLGVSSFQFDEGSRGFSFRDDGPLDMRMSRAGMSAADAVNTLPETELAAILWRYGEEKRSRAIARAVVAARPLARTRELAELVERVAGPAAKREKIHPATRTFQALRIYVNDELGELERGLAAAERTLATDGRLAVVSFHSLEDRIVKQFLSLRSGRDARGSRHAPVRERRAATFALLGPQPQLPSAAEIAANPRARSAKLRAGIRTAAPAWPADGDMP